MEEGKETEEAAGRKPPLPEENEARVVGRIVNAPKLKEGTTGKGDPYKMARLTLAVNRRSGRDREADFVPVVLWDALADAVAKAGKGTALRVSGRIKTYEVEGKGYRWELKAETLEVLELRKPARAGAEEEQKELLPQ